MQTKTLIGQIQKGLSRFNEWPSPPKRFVRWARRGLFVETVVLAALFGLPWLVANIDPLIKVAQLVTASVAVYLGWRASRGEDAGLRLISVDTVARVQGCRCGRPEVIRFQPLVAWK